MADHLDPALLDGAQGSDQKVSSQLEAPRAPTEISIGNVNNAQGYLSVWGE